jgi:SAM-dependent methyltransferase
MIEPVRKALRYVEGTIGLRVERLRKRPSYGADDSRLGYQEQYVHFKVKAGDKVLDIGNGGYPFPYATVVADRYAERSPSRREGLVTADKPFVMTDIHDLPFAAKSFDYVYCSHVLEVIDDPIKACKEIQRVGKRGYVETPTLGKDTLFAWARNLQKWHVVAIGPRLCFFEYSERQLDGIRSSIWRDLIMSKWHNPLQEVFYKNQDVFNVMFPWDDVFSVLVFRLDGTITALNNEGLGCTGSR